MQIPSLFVLFFNTENRFTQSRTCHISATAVPIDLLLDLTFRLLPPSTTSYSAAVFLDAPLAASLKLL